VLIVEPLTNIMHAEIVLIYHAGS